MNTNVAADLANMHAHAIDRQPANIQTLVNTIMVSGACNAYTDLML
jgi:hypothetical protein